MSERNYIDVTNVADPGLTRRYIGKVIEFASADRTGPHHSPSSGAYWRAFDLAHIALFLNGVNVWDTKYPTGGASVTTSRRLADDYLSARGPLTIAALEEYSGVGYIAWPDTKIVVGLGARLRGYVEFPRHPYHEGTRGELIATSLRFSDIDTASQGLIQEIFELPAGFDAEFVSNSSATP